MRIKNVVMVGVFLLAANAFAADLESTTVRVTCENAHSGDPYVSVRGNMTIETQNGYGQARGRLRIGLGSGGNPGRSAEFQGQYVEQRNSKFMILRSSDMSIREVYIELGRGFGRNSSIELSNGAFYRMACRVQ